MKKTNRLVAFLTAVMILTACLCTAAAGEETAAATPTDLEPAVTEDNSAEEPSEIPGEEAAEEPESGVEIIIAKTLRTGDTWSGTLKRNTPTILKLDVSEAQTVYILVEGKNIRALVRRAGSSDEDVPYEMTDPETNRVTTGLDAQAGSYLILLEPGEGSMMAKATVSILDREAYETRQTADEAAAEEAADADPPAEEPDGNGNEPEAAEEENPEPAAQPAPEEEEPEEPEDVTAENRTIGIRVTWDTTNPVIGDTAHFRAELEGYEELTYTMQWQYSRDRKDWNDLPGETNETMDVTVTEENNVYYWRIVVYVEENLED